MKHASETPGTKPARSGIHIGLWVAQVFLGFGFGGAGVMKLVTPYADLVAQQAWAQHTPAALVMLIGVVELAGAVGVILPAATRIRPLLTPLAAAGFVAIMVPAGVLHAVLGEPPIANVVLGALAGFVAWGRFKKAPIPAR